MRKFRTFADVPVAAVLRRTTTERAAGHRPEKAERLTAEEEKAIGQRTSAQTGCRRSIGAGWHGTGNIKIKT
jgi:hypothetical protein